MKTNFHDWILTPEGMSALGSEMVQPLTALELAYTCGVLAGMVETKQQAAEIIKGAVFVEGLGAKVINDR
jgi:hypothetical protein